MQKLEDCISTALGKDRILLIVDDVERCDIKKAQQFIGFIKEIATLRNCISIFITDYEYLNQRQSQITTGDSDKLEKANHFFYEKFFNCRIDVPPIYFGEVVGQLEQMIQEQATKLGFRLPSDLYGNFEEKLQSTVKKYREEAESAKDDSIRGDMKARASEMERLCVQFRSDLALPRTMVKFFHVIKIGYSNLIAKYVKNDLIEEEASNFFSSIKFDEILFFLVYAEVCTPYEFLNLKKEGFSYLQCDDVIEDDTRKLLREMGRGLLYDNNRNIIMDNQTYLYNEAAIFTRAYLNGDLPEQVNGFSSRDEMWIDAIKRKDKENIETFWEEMIHMVAQNFSLKDPEKGKEYLNSLFSYARENFLNEPGWIERIFSIFEKDYHNEDVFSGTIAVMELFWKNFKNSLEKCSQKNVMILEQFSSVYFWKRTQPICSAAMYLAPAECGKDRDFQTKISDANDLTLYDRNPTEKLKRLLNKICEIVPSISLPADDDVFQQLLALGKEEKNYLEENEMLQYDDIKYKIQLFEVAIKDMECFALLLEEVKENTVPTGTHIPIEDLSKLDTIIQQFKNVLNTPNSNKDVALLHRFRSLFDNIRFSNIKINDRHYEELQNLITEYGKIFGTFTYSRKILLDHREKNIIDSAYKAMMQNQDEEESYIQ